MANKFCYPLTGRVDILQPVLFDEMTFSFKDPGNLCASV